MTFLNCLLFLLCPLIANACHLVEKTDVLLHRNLLENGFHRKLETNISIISRQDISSCLLMVHETIPTGAYLDPYELQNYKSFVGFDFYLPEIVSVETPEHRSPKFDAYFFGSLSKYEEDFFTFSIQVPIHIRYHAARSGSRSDLTETVRIPLPGVFISCDHDIIGRKCSSLTELQPCSSGSNQMCDFLELRLSKVEDDAEAVIPVGNTDHLETILFCTTTVTFSTCALLVLTVYKAKRPGN